MRVLVTLFLCLSFGPLQAQPISHSMAQCSALAYAISTWQTEPEIADEFAHLSGTLFDTAFDQAQREGVEQPFETLNNLANQTENAWLSRGRNSLFTGTFKNWIGYCQALAFDYELEFHAP